MRHLIAKRNRVRDILTELENDPHAYVSDKELREVIDDANFTFLLVERQQLRELRWSREMAEHGSLDERKSLPGVYSFQEKLIDIKNDTEKRRGQLEKWEEERAEAEYFIGIHTKAIRQMFDDIRARWAALTPREQAAFGRPPVNPLDVFDFGTHVIAEKALHYPEPTANHITATAKLRHVLEWLDAEIAKEGGK